MLRVPATTFVITHSPPRSKRRDGFDFLRKERRGKGAGPAGRRLHASSIPRRRRSPNGSNGSAQMVSMVSRPLLKTPFIAKPNGACGMRSRRGFAPPGLHKQADCRKGRLVSDDRQPHPAGASTGFRQWNRSNRCAATSASIPARSSTLKSRSWVALRKSATASRVTARPSNRRGVGWEYLYLAIDDHSLAAYEQAFVGLGACCAR